MIDYFSDRENGPVARMEEVITPVVWAAIAGTVSRRTSQRMLGKVRRRFAQDIALPPQSRILRA